MLQTALSVPYLLQEAIPPAIARMAAAILAPVSAVSCQPPSLALSLVGLIVSISCQSLPLPQSLPGTLANLAAAVTLVLYPGISTKQTSTMFASDHTVHGLPSKEKP